MIALARDSSPSPDPGLARIEFDAALAEVRALAAAWHARKAARQDPPAQGPAREPDRQ